MSGRVSKNIMLILGFCDVCCICQLLKFCNFLWFVFWIFTSVNYFYTCNFKLFFLRKDLQIMSGLRLGNLNLPVSGGQEYTFAISGQPEVIRGKTDTLCPGLGAWQADSSWTNMPLRAGGSSGRFASSALMNITGFRSMKSTPPAQRSVLQPK